MLIKDNTRTGMLNRKEREEKEREKEKKERALDKSRAKIGEPIGMTKIPPALNNFVSDKDSVSNPDSASFAPKPKEDTGTDHTGNNSSGNTSKGSSFTNSGRQFDSYALSDEYRASQNKTSFDEATEIIDKTLNPYGNPTIRTNPASTDDKPLYHDSEDYQSFKDLIATCDPEKGIYIIDDADGRMVTNPAIVDGAEKYIINKIPQTPKTYVRDHTYSYVNEYVHAGNDPEKLEELSKKYVVSPQLTTYAEITPFMNEQERRDFYILYNSGYKEEALQYLETLEPETNKRRRDYELALITEQIEGNDWLKVPLSVQALAMNLMSGLVGMVQPFGMLFNPDEWGNIDQYSPVYDYAAYSSFITENIADDIAENSKLASLGYEAIMNVAEGASEKLVFGPMSEVASFMGDVYVDNYNNISSGMDANRAYLTSIGGNALNLGISKAVGEVGGVYKKLPDDFSFKNKQQVKKLLQDTSTKAAGNLYGSLNYAYWDYLLNRNNPNRTYERNVNELWGRAWSDAVTDTILLF